MSLKCDETSAQCLFQIHDQVVGILNSDRNANERRRDTQPQPFFFRNVRMRHRRRMRSKRLVGNRYSLRISACTISARAIIRAVHSIPSSASSAERQGLCATKCLAGKWSGRPDRPPGARPRLRRQGGVASGLSLLGHAQGPAVAQKLGKWASGSPPRCSKTPVRTPTPESILARLLRPRRWVA